MNKPVYLLHGRETCHLCHDMWADILVLRQQQQLDFELVWVDIEDTQSDGQHHPFDWRIPVLTTANEHIICEGRLDATALLAALAAS